MTSFKEFLNEGSKKYKVKMENGASGIYQSIVELKLPLSLRTKGVDDSGNKVALIGKVVSFELMNK